MRRPRPLPDAARENPPDGARDRTRRRGGGTGAGRPDADRPGEARPPRVLVVAGNTFKNRGDAALTIALDQEFRRLLPDAQVTYSLRSPDEAATALPDRRLIPQLVPPPVAPGARLARLARRADGRLAAGAAVLQAHLLVRWARLWAWADRRSPSLAGRLLGRVMARTIAEVRAADIVVAVPGGYILAAGPGDVTWTHAVAPLMVAAALGIPTAVAPSTIGPIPASQLPAARLALARASLVQVRETRSVPWVRRCGVREERIDISADVALLTVPAATIPDHIAERLAAGRATGAPLVGVSVKDFHFPWAADPSLARGGYLEAVATALDRLVEGRGIQPVFVPQVLAPPVTDVDVAREVMGRMRRPATVFEMPLAAEELAALYGRFDVLLGLRIHAGVLAMAAGTPFVAIAYGIKHAGIMEDLGLGRYVVDIRHLDPDWLVEAVAAALDDRPALQALLAARVPELQARVRAGSERLADLIRAASGTRTD